MNQFAAHEILEQIFAVVIDEAKKNPKFAKKVISALPKGVVAKVEKQSTSVASQPAFDVDQYHAVNVLRNYGEGVLEGRLSELTKDKLKQVAAYSGLVLTGSAANKSASKSLIIQGIIEAAKQYVAQRDIALA